MEEILEKRISRIGFLKTCTFLAIAGIVSLSSLNFLSKKNNISKGYGSGPYGK